MQEMAFLAFPTLSGGACPQIPLGGGSLQPPEALQPLTSELIETAGLN